MLHVSTVQSSAFATAPAARWIGLAEMLLASGRIFRDALQGQFGPSRLSESQFSALWACAVAPSSGLGQKELAARLACSPAQVSGLVEQLRCEQLLEGHRDPADRRRQFWQITPAGQAALQAVLADVADWSLGLEQSLGGELTDLLETLLAKLIRAVAQRESAQTSPPMAAKPAPSIHPLPHRGAA